MATPRASRPTPSGDPASHAPSRIALIASSAYPNPGGVEQHVRHVARELTSRGYAVEVWTVARDGVPGRLVVDDVPVLRLPAPLPAMNPRSVAGFAASVPRAWRAWSDAVRAFRPTLLHVQCFGPNGVYALALSRRFGIPLAVSSHGETFMDEDAVFEQSTLLRAALRSSLARAEFVTGCSEFTLADLRARFGLRDGHVVFNGVDPVDAADPGDGDDHRESGGGPTVLAVGRLVHVKGMDLLLQAFAEASLPHGTSLVIGGDGAERSSLEASAARLGIADRVRFLGRLDPEGVARAMAQASVLVVPSRVEAFGIVVLEGWRATLPVIATEHGGPAEFLTHLRDGVLVDPDDPSTIARALEDVLGDPQPGSGCLERAPLGAVAADDEAGAVRQRGLGERPQQEVHALVVG